MPSCARPGPCCRACDSATRPTPTPAQVLALASVGICRFCAHAAVPYSIILPDTRATGTYRSYRRPCGRLGFHPHSKARGSQPDSLLDGVSQLFDLPANTVGGGEAARTLGDGRDHLIHLERLRYDGDCER